ncbi:MAG: PH domain-containing protein [Candidatus Pacebacteria bacterium]|nr:PH domain-containing protein [Candidatus Paceibacterota bacterium]
MSNSIKSNFQINNPLNPRKFWKKFLEEAVSISLLSAFLSLIIFVVYILSNTQLNSSESLVTVGISIYLTMFISLMIFEAIYIKAYIKYYFYDTDSDFITIKKGIFSPTEIHVQYQKIQDVYVDQDIIDRVIGLYDVHIASATANSGIEAHIDGVDAETAERLKNTFLQKIKERSNNYYSLEMNKSSTTSNEQTKNKSETFNINEEVSIKTYPISGNWIIARMLGSIMWSFFYTLLVCYVLFSTGESSFSVANKFQIQVNTLIISLIFFILFIFKNIYTFFWKKTFSFKFTPEYIYLKSGIISRQEKHAPYNTIQDVTIEQGIIDRVLGISNVKITNASQQAQTGQGGFLFNGILIPGQPLDKAQKIADILKNGALLHTSKQRNGL